MRVLLTGATGFVGRHVLGRLIAREAAITVVARSEAPPDLRDLVARGDVHWLVTDLTDPRRIGVDRSVLADTSHVIALAAQTVKRAGDRVDATALFRSNVVALVGLIERLPLDPRHFCYVSTLDVYGPAFGEPIDEAHPTRPPTDYGVTKLTAERVCAMMCAARDCSLCVLRLAHVYGPGEEEYDKVIPVFVRRALAGEKIEIAGPGSDERDFVYVADVADGIVRAVDAGAEGTFNIASGESIAVRALAEIIADLVPGTPVTTGPSDRPPSSLRFDITRAKTVFAFSPRTPLREGLSREIEHVRALSSARRD